MLGWNTGSVTPFFKMASKSFAGRIYKDVYFLWFCVKVQMENFQDPVTPYSVSKIAEASGAPPRGPTGGLTSVFLGNYLRSTKEIKAIDSSTIDKKYRLQVGLLLLRQSFAFKFWMLGYCKLFS